MVVLLLLIVALGVVVGFVFAVRAARRDFLQSQIRMRQSAFPPRPVQRTPVRARPAPSAVGDNGRVRVGADRRPLWEVRGWRREGSGRLVGAYRTPVGSCRGEIMVDGQMRPHDFYIFTPPKGLLSGPHGACFRRRGDRYWIHFSITPATVDAGLVQVEQLLRDALRRTA